MTENQTQPNSPAPAQGDLPLDSVASPAVSQQTSEPPAPTRPQWVSDEYYDPQKGVKFDELGARFNELNEYRSKREAELAARKAEMPESEEGYGVLGKDDGLPEGFQIDENHPMWKFLRNQSFSKNFTKSEFKEIAKGYVEVAAQSQKEFLAKVEAERKQLFSTLGENGAQRVDAVKNWFNASFGEKVGGQLALTLHTPDIVKAMEKIQTALTNQGAGSFNGLGRDGVGGGDIEGWDKMTFEQRWAARSQLDRRAN
jgi:hypothetical protein